MTTAMQPLGWSPVKNSLIDSIDRSSAAGPTLHHLHEAQLQLLVAKTSKLQEENAILRERMVQHIDKAATERQQLLHTVWRSRSSLRKCQSQLRNQVQAHGKGLGMRRMRVGKLDQFFCVLAATSNLAKTMHHTSQFFYLH